MLCREVSRASQVISRKKSLCFNIDSSSCNPDATVMPKAHNQSSLPTTPAQHNTTQHNTTRDGVTMISCLQHCFCISHNHWTNPNNERPALPPLFVSYIVFSCTMLLGCFMSCDSLDPCQCRSEIASNTYGPEWNLFVEWIKSRPSSCQFTFVGMLWAFVPFLRIFQWRILYYYWTVLSIT